MEKKKQATVYMMTMVKLMTMNAELIPGEQ